MKEKMRIDTKSNKSGPVSNLSDLDNFFISLSMSMSCSTLSSHWHLASACADLSRQKSTFERIAESREDFILFMGKEIRALAMSSEERGGFNLFFHIDDIEKVRAETKGSPEPKKRHTLLLLDN